MAKIADVQQRIIQLRDAGTGRRVLYIAGPMSNIADHNVPAFRAAARRFRDAGGFAVLCPPEFSINTDPDRHTYPHHLFLRHDIERLISCTAITLLPGWEKSTGARCEAAIAKTLGMIFYDPDTCQPCATPAVISITCGYGDPRP